MHIHLRTGSQQGRLCLPLFPVAIAKYPDKSNLGEDRVYFISQFQVTAHYFRKAEVAGTQTASHILSHEQRVKARTLVLSSPSPFLNSPHHKSREWYCPLLGWVAPPHQLT